MAAGGRVLRCGTPVLRDSWATRHLNGAVVRLAAMPDGEGYRPVDPSGGPISHWGAGCHGSVTSLLPAEPVVGVNDRGGWDLG